MTWSASAASLAALTLAGAAVTHGVAARREARAIADHPPQGEFVEVDGTRIHYLRRGSGPDLVLIHGAGGNLRDFTFAFMDRAAEHFTVTALDRPGLGYSGRARGVPTRGLARTAESLAQQAALLRGAAERLGIVAPVVLGHSFGGAVALAWALADLADPSPASARALVPVAAATHPWPGGLGPIYAVNGTRLGGAVVVPALTAFVPERRIATAIASSFDPQPPIAGYAEHLGGRLTLRRSTFRANIRQVNTLRPQIVAMAERYGELALPIEVVHGTRDRVTPIEIHGAPLAEAAPAARLTALEGVGHMPHHVAPDAVMQAVLRARERCGG
jgi:pimeloyl-ACP methyl ester carboxylesterase